MCNRWMETLFINAPAVFKNKLPLLLFHAYGLCIYGCIFLYGCGSVAQGLGDRKMLGLNPGMERKIRKSLFKNSVSVLTWTSVLSNICFTAFQFLYTGNTSFTFKEVYFTSGNSSHGYPKVSIFFNQSFCNQWHREPSTYKPRRLCVNCLPSYASGDAVGVCTW